jgi:hypothetical protein
MKNPLTVLEELYRTRHERDEFELALGKAVDWARELEARVIELQAEPAAMAAAMIRDGEQIERLRQHVADLQSGMWINCVYCGHRYGPGETTPVSMADALKAHIETCPEHPMSALRAELSLCNDRVTELETRAELSDMQRIKLRLYPEEVERLRAGLLAIERIANECADAATELLAAEKKVPGASEQLIYGACAATNGLISKKLRVALATILPNGSAGSAEVGQHTGKGAVFNEAVASPAQSAAVESMGKRPAEPEGTLRAKLDAAERFAAELAASPTVFVQDLGKQLRAELEKA